MNVRFLSSCRARETGYPTTSRSVPLVFAFLFGTLLSDTARGQDSLTVGTGSARSGSTASVPIYLRDVGGTPLGGDRGGGSGIHGIAFRIIYDASSAVTAISFVRAGVLASVSPYYERVLPSAGSLAYVAWFSDPIPLTLDAPAPGNQIGTLSVTFSNSAAAGTSVALTIDSATTTLGNRAGLVGEKVSGGTLSIAAGSAVVTTTITAPSGLLATATSASQVSVIWSAVAGATGYQVWRSSNNQPYALVGSPTAASFTDAQVSAGITYLYKALAVDGSMAQSPFSNTDPATTITFVDETVVAQSTTIKATHILQLREAVNMFRAAAGLGPASFSDLSLAGVAVRAVHIDELRAAVNAARMQLLLGSASFTDTVLSPSSTVVKAIHVMELRQSVR